MSSNKSKDLTAMKNARLWVELRRPGALLIEASKKMARFPDKKNPGEWITHTVSEDVWGVFDLIACPLRRHYLIDLIQVTTITDGKLANVNARLSKVGTWVRDTFPPHQAPDWIGDIYVIGWVLRKHFRVWKWHWSKTDATHWGGWKELDPAPVKRPKEAGSVRAASAQTTPPSMGGPFD